MAIYERSVSVLLLAIGIVLTVVFRLDPSKITTNAHFIPPPKILKQFTFGYGETLADVVWLRVIQDFDTCDGAKALPVPVSPAEDVLVGKHKWADATCEKGWVYQMIDFVTDMAPDFRTPYIYGSLMMSVIISDRAGATLLLEKALKRFPASIPIHINAAYHYLYEERQPTRAAELLKRAGDLGAPPWVYGLASKIYDRNNSKALAIGILDDALRKVTDPEVRKKLEKRRQEILHE